MPCRHKRRPRSASNDHDHDGTNDAATEYSSGDGDGSDGGGGGGDGGGDGGIGGLQANEAADAILDVNANASWSGVNSGEVVTNGSICDHFTAQGAAIGHSNGKHWYGHGPTPVTMPVRPCAVKDGDFVKRATHEGEDHAETECEDILVIHDKDAACKLADCGTRGGLRPPLHQANAAAIVNEVYR